LDKEFFRIIFLKRNPKFADDIKGLRLGFIPWDNLILWYCTFLRPFQLTEEIVGTSATKKCILKKIIEVLIPSPPIYASYKTIIGLTIGSPNEIKKLKI